MARDLFPIGPIAIAQFSSNVLVRFRYKSENGLIAFLAFVFRVIPLARPHLPAIERVHRGIGVQRDRRQPYVGCGPHPFAQNALSCNSCPARFRFSEARNRQNTLCPGSLLTFRIPVSIGPGPQNEGG